MLTLTVNGRTHTVDVEPEMPLLYALRNDLGLNNPHFGCGLAQCGACTVHVDGEPTFADQSPYMRLYSAGVARATTGPRVLPLVYVARQRASLSPPHFAGQADRVVLSSCHTEWRRHMCMTLSPVAGLTKWNWDGDCIVHDCVVPSGRPAVGHIGKRYEYPIDVREFLVAERNEVE